jgi:hypothetical protein
VSGGEDGHINITTLGANRPSVFAYKGHKNPDDEVVDEECSIEDLEFLQLYVLSCNPTLFWLAPILDKIHFTCHDSLFF